jgi:hypothetical protein
MAQDEPPEADEYLPSELVDRAGEPSETEDRLAPAGPPPLDVSVADWVDQLREEPLEDDLRSDT